MPVTRMPRIENVLRPSERARGTHIDTVTGEEMGCNRPPGTTVCHGELLVNDLVESRDALGGGCYAAGRAFWVGWLQVGCAMVGRGELGFVLATESLEAGMLEQRASLLCYRVGSRARHASRPGRLPTLAARAAARRHRRARHRRARARQFERRAASGRDRPSRGCGSAEGRWSSAGGQQVWSLEVEHLNVKGKTVF